MPLVRALSMTMLTTTLLGATPALADVKVIASIKPVHSLVAAIMDGAGTPELLVEGAASPHVYSLKPSQAAALEDADLVFWVGPQVEGFLERPIATVAQSARSVAMMETRGLLLLEQRAGGAFDVHDHGDHGDEHAHDHDHDDDHAHDHDEHAHDDHHDHSDHSHAHDGHAHADGALDGHVWLDPQNAAMFGSAIAAALSEADPANAALYARNADGLVERLASLETQISAMLASPGDRGFVVFHDAYQYFENRFGLQAAGSITVNPDVMPGPDRLREIRARIEELQAACVFSEPQFEPRLISVVSEGTQAKPLQLDPLGANLVAGPDHYFELITNMATAFADCLGDGQ